MNPSTLDTQALNLAKAIRKAETGTSSDPYNAKGASGEYGAYQYMPDTWKQWSKQYLGREGAEMSVENQNKVAYARIKELKDQGLNPAQIASTWNSGNPDRYKQNWKGVNSQGVQYDTPGYVQKVSQYYNELKGTQQAAPIGNTEFQTSTAQPEDGSILSKLQTTSDVPEKQSQVDFRLQQGSEALGKLSQGLVNRDISQIGSGALQTGGAIAGGLLDLTGAALKSIPILGNVVQGAEDVLGGVTKAAMDTQVGQDIQGAYQSLSPETQKNLGAVGNIASAVPLVKGAAMGLKSAKAGVTNVIKGPPEKAIAEELTNTVNRVRTGNTTLRTATERGIDPIQTIIKEKAFPDIKTDARGVDRYDTIKAEETLAKTIDDLDDQLDAVLTNASSKVSGYVPFKDLKVAVLDAVKKEFKGSPELNSAIRKVEDDFDSITAGYNDDLITLNELNNIKRRIRKSVNFDSPSIDRNVRYHEGQVIMRVIEDVAEKQGLGTVRQLNKEMAQRIEAEEILRKYIHGKSIADNPGLRGMFGKQGEASATAAGEAIGQSFGVPMAGGILSRKFFDATTKADKSALARLPSNRR